MTTTYRLPTRFSPLSILGILLFATPSMAVGVKSGIAVVGPESRVTVATTDGAPAGKVRIFECQPGVDLTNEDCRVPTTSASATLELETFGIRLNRITRLPLRGLDEQVEQEVAAYGQRLLLSPSLLGYERSAKSDALSKINGFIENMAGGDKSLLSDDKKAEMERLQEEINALDEQIELLTSPSDVGDAISETMREITRSKITVYPYNDSSLKARLFITLLKKMSYLDDAVDDEPCGLRGSIDQRAEKCSDGEIDFASGAVARLVTRIGPDESDLYQDSTGTLWARPANIVSLRNISWMEAVDACEDFSKTKPFGLERKSVSWSLPDRDDFAPLLGKLVSRMFMICKAWVSSDDATFGQAAVLNACRQTGAISSSRKDAEHDVVCKGQIN